MRVRSFNGSGLTRVRSRLVDLSDRQTNGTGPSAEVCVTGNSNRDLGLFTDAPKGVK
jgi:hypothetical protein